MTLAVAPITLKEANAFVEHHHRHHGPRQGHTWSIAVLHDGRLAGVAIAGRPSSRILDDGRTLEVYRVCTDGTPNACSKLYGAVRRIAQAMGYVAVLTYTLDWEDGASLRAAGWRPDRQVKGEAWGRQGRTRLDKHPTGPKIRWRAPG